MYRFLCLERKLAAAKNNSAMITLLNSSPANNINSDASVAVANAIHNQSRVSLFPQTFQQKLVGRKITNARVRNNNNRVNLPELPSHLSQQVPQGQTVVNLTQNFATHNFSNVPIKQQVIGHRLLPSTPSDNRARSALLVGTSSADRQDILSSNVNSVLLEKVPARSPNSVNFIQSPKSSQYGVQSPKGVISPLSSPPPQNSNTINVQSLNFVQSLSTLQNLQVQLPGFSSPNMSSSGALQGHPTSIIVSMPVTTATATGNTITQQAACNIFVNAGANPTVLLTNTGGGSLSEFLLRFFLHNLFWQLQINILITDGDNRGFQ